MLIAILGGLAAAVCWTTSALCSSQASRDIGAGPTLALVMGFGLLLVIVPLVLTSSAENLPVQAIVLLCVAGASNVVGLRLQYVTMRHVPVGIVSAIASTEGVVAAVIAFVLGGPLPWPTVVILVVISAAVALAAVHLEPAAVSASTGAVAAVPRPDRLAPRLSSRTRWTLALVPVAGLFGTSLYTTGRAGREVPLIFVMSTARVMGTAFFAAPLVVRKRLRLTRRSLPLVLAAGAAEVVGILVYAVGARHGIAVAAVFASQFGALTPIAALLLFKERLQPHQVLGIAVIAVCVAVFSALSG